MNNPIKTIIIDDETDAREILRFHLEKFSTIHLIGEASSVASGIKTINELQPELVFLDIEMDDGSGFDLLAQFEQPDFKVVFVTAHDEFALKAFKFNAIDYILKPVDQSEIYRVIEKVVKASNSNFMSQISGLLQTVREKKFEKIMLPSAEGIHVIAVNDIVSLSADSSYVQINLVNDEKLVVSKSLKELEEMLNNGNFFRSHQSHIVNLKFVKRLTREGGGFIELKNGAQAPISRRKKDLFLERLSKF